MPLRPTVLPALSVFATAARHQNFAHAAEELHLTASAVSHHVRRLEATLGMTLFQRHSRGVVLTSQGRTLADAANSALADLEAISTSLRAETCDIVHLRIATLHSLTYSWLLPRLANFTALHPRIRLDIETSIGLARFTNDGPDLAIRHGAGHWPGLVAHHLMNEELFPVAAPALARDPAIKVAADIVKLPMITDCASQGWRDWFRAAGMHSVPLPHMHSFSDSTDALQAAVLGLGATLARTHIVAPYMHSGQLARLPGPAMKAKFAYYAVHPADRRPNRAAAAFIEWLKWAASNGPVTVGAPDGNGEKHKRDNRRSARGSLKR